MSLNPAVNSLLQLFDKRSRLNTEPSDVYLVAHLTNRVLNFIKEGNLIVKNIKRGGASNNTVKDLLGHVVEVKGLFFDASIFSVFARASKFELLAEDLLKRISRVQEGLEACLELFLPKELLIVVLLEEVVGGLLDLVQVVGHILELSHQEELVLDLVKEITVS